jgi:uncharacterized membrane protein SpoIIM required for sporulation
MVVFEHLFPDELLERKEWTAFFLALIYSILSLFIARLLFPANSGIVSVIFVSIFLIPYFSTILKREELQIAKDKNRRFWHLLKDNQDALETYLYIFLGIYLGYMAFAFFAPHLGFDIGRMFGEQLALESLRGGATFEWGTFSSILLNNWWVLLACFVIALIAGDGAIFFIAWNASTWGTIFGYRAFMASMNTGDSALIFLATIVLFTLPHLLLEGGAYILAAFSGGLMSDLVDKMDEVRKFVVYFISSAAIFFVLIFLLRAMFFPGGMALYGQDSLRVVLFNFAEVVIAMALLFCMQFLLDDAEDSQVFRYNYYLFLGAIGIFIIGALVETFVLYNAMPLQRAYFAAMFG